MSTLTLEQASANDGVWLPLPEAAAALRCSVDTVRRRIKRGLVAARLSGTRYLVHVDNRHVAEASTPGPLAVVVEDIHPSVRAVLDYVRERDLVRDRELAQLREELARARADLVLAQAALPPGKPWGPFSWLRQLWAAQT